VGAPQTTTMVPTGNCVHRWGSSLAEDAAVAGEDVLAECTGRLVLAGLMQVLREVIRRRQGIQVILAELLPVNSVRAQPTVVLLGILRVLLTGTMRLPIWFTVGVIHQDTAGFTPAKIKDGQRGSSPPIPSCPAPITLPAHVAQTSS
jgi:hypothetical protein